jgi:hypothetical protein
MRIAMGSENGLAQGRKRKVQNAPDAYDLIAHHNTNPRCGKAQERRQRDQNAEHESSAFYSLE